LNIKSVNGFDIQSEANEIKCLTIIVTDWFPNLKSFNYPVHRVCRLSQTLVELTVEASFYSSMMRKMNGSRKNERNDDTELTKISDSKEDDRDSPLLLLLLWIRFNDVSYREKCENCSFGYYPSQCDAPTCIIQNKCHRCIPNYVSETYSCRYHSNRFLHIDCAKHYRHENKCKCLCRETCAIMQKNFLQDRSRSCRDCEKDLIMTGLCQKDPSKCSKCNTIMSLANWQDLGVNAQHYLCISCLSESTSLPSSVILSSDEDVDDIIEKYKNKQDRRCSRIENIVILILCFFVSCSFDWYFR
jgi:hypothetical protein